MLATLAASYLPPDRTASGVQWEPHPGPQAAAFASEADQIGYGGAAGGGKSDLLLGLAGREHRRSILLRRVFPSLSAMIERSREIYNPVGAAHSEDTFNESLHRWRLVDGRMVMFRAVQYETDLRKYQGQPHDLIGIDEATEWPERWVRFLSGWNRTTVPDQRCRLVLTFNPPMSDEQNWVVRYFAPWLDPGHPDPAADGELRYVAWVDDEEHFYRDPADIPPDDDGPRAYKARTFFHAALKDNPALAATGYGATIDTLPEPLRSLLRGSFAASRAVNPWQVIPSAWVAEAQARWRADGKRGLCSGVGLDVARGGQDQTADARLFGSWVAPLRVVPGAATPTGGDAAALVLDAAQAGLPVGVDIIGIGASSYDHLRGLGLMTVVGVNASAKAEDARGQPITDRTGQLRFRNLRAAMWWLLREALDPSAPDPLALPPDEQLAAELQSPTWSLTSGGILVESKDEIRARLGRSTNRADPVAMALIVPQLLPAVIPVPVAAPVANRWKVPQ